MNTPGVTLDPLTRCFKETTAVNQMRVKVHAGESFSFQHLVFRYCTDLLHHTQRVVQPPYFLDLATREVVKGYA